ncbi:MAG: aminoacetone oxidase family FAD-binding enzyme, partial [Lentisphaeria bacterium]|nr:aminoacetone oxidase family FAD-binding enzyme [Lentisphaeria bacterium]
KGVLLKDGRRVDAEKVILAGGGCAWSPLGSKKGLLPAGKCGHTIVDVLPAVAPLHIREEWVKSLAGVSLEKAEILLYEEKSSSGGRKKRREIWKTAGNLLFTHDGLSGFAALDMAEAAGKMCRKNGSAAVLLRLFPQRTKVELSLLPEIYRKEYGNKLIRSLLAERERLPHSLADHIARLAGCDGMSSCRLTAESKDRLLALLCDGVPLTVESAGPMEKAMAMSGGVSLKEIDPATMESKLVKGLYFAGEVMDLVGPCGGYNIQWAFSSGRLAGQNAAK